jgi:hypothetical protein
MNQFNEDLIYQAAVVVLGWDFADAVLDHDAFGEAVIAQANYMATAQE